MTIPLPSGSAVLPFVPVVNGQPVDLSAGAVLGLDLFTAPYPGQQVSGDPVLTFPATGSGNSLSFAVAAPWGIYEPQVRWQAAAGTPVITTVLPAFSLPGASPLVSAADICTRAVVNADTYSDLAAMLERTAEGLLAGRLNRTGLCLAARREYASYLGGDPRVYEPGFLPPLGLLDGVGNGFDLTDTPVLQVLAVGPRDGFGRPLVTYVGGPDGVNDPACQPLRDWVLEVAATNLRVDAARVIGDPALGRDVQSITVQSQSVSWKVTTRGSANEQTASPAGADLDRAVARWRRRRVNMLQGHSGAMSGTGGWGTAP